MCVVVVVIQKYLDQSRVHYIAQGQFDFVRMDFHQISKKQKKLLIAKDFFELSKTIIYAHTLTARKIKTVINKHVQVLIRILMLHYLFYFVLFFALVLLIHLLKSDDMVSCFSVHVEQNPLFTFVIAADHYQTSSYLFGIIFFCSVGGENNTQWIHWMYNRIITLISVRRNKKKKKKYRNQITQNEFKYIHHNMFVLQSRTMNLQDIQ